MRIYPADISVNVGEWASVTCRVPCELELNRSHTFKWFVGDHRTRKVESDFEERTGIKVETETTRPCTGRSGEARHQLRVFASSAEIVNRTAVQCAALRKGRDFTDYYSYFAVILVKGIILLIHMHAALTSGIYITRMHVCMHVCMYVLCALAWLHMHAVACNYTSGCFVMECMHACTCMVALLQLLCPKANVCTLFSKDLCLQINYYIHTLIG